MRIREVERLLISTLLAAAFFTAGFFIFNAIDLPVYEMPEYVGPVFITIAEDPRLLSAEIRNDRVSPELIPRETPDNRQTSPEIPDSIPEPFASSETVRGEQGGPVESAGNEYTPSENTQSGSGTDPQGDLSRDKGIDTGSAEHTPLPQGGTIGRPQGDEAGTVEPVDPAGAESGQEEPGNSLDFSDLDTALAQAGEVFPDESGREVTETAKDLGTAGNPVDFETLSAYRKPLFLPAPEIGPELASSIATDFDIIISFTLLPSGYITDLNIEPDSGNTKIDSIIQNTIKIWRFEPVSQEAGSIKVRVLYTIRVR